MREADVWREALTPEKALSVLAQGAGKEFDPMLVGAFAEMIGIFPVGAAVELNTGESSIVAALSARDPLRPTVQILSDASGRLLDSPDVVALSEDALGGGTARVVARSLPFIHNCYIKELTFL